MKISKVHKRVSRYVEIEGEVDTIDNFVSIASGDPSSDSIRIELAHEPSEYYGGGIKIARTSTGYRVGYMVNDEDPLDPTSDCDGFGKFGERGSRVRNDIQDIYREAAGLDRYGDQKFDIDNALQELVEWVWPNQTYKDWPDLLIDPKAKAERSNIKRPYRGKWDKIIEQHKAWGDFGDPDAVFLNIYEHGGKMYEVPGTLDYRVDAMFDWSWGAAVWVPDKVLRVDEANGLTGKKRREKIVEWAKQAVKVYNEYMNGSVYGVVIQEHDFNGDLLNEDSCYGFYGTDDAERELEDRMKNYNESVPSR